MSKEVKKRDNTINSVVAKMLGLNLREFIKDEKERERAVRKLMLVLSSYLKEIEFEYIRVKNGKPFKKIYTSTVSITNSISNAYKDVENQPTRKEIEKLVIKLLNGKVIKLPNGIEFQRRIKK